MHRHLSVILLMLSLYICISAAADKNPIEKIPTNNSPEPISDENFTIFTEENTLNEEQMEFFRLKEISGYQSNYLYTPFFKFQPDSVSTAIVMLYDYSEEWGAILQVFDNHNELSDYTQIFYDNSGGHSFTSSEFKNGNTVIRKRVPFNAYDENTKPVYDTLLIENGMIKFKNPQKTDTAITINSKDVTVPKYGNFQRHLDVLYAYGPTKGRKPITDEKLLEILWSDSSESYKLDPKNGKSTIHRYFSVSTTVSALSVLYNGGCLELWVFTINKETNQITGKFTASETCASDAEDYSSGLFLTPTTYEKNSRWINEYPEKGEDPENSI
ncbi:MAG: hypothetical protein ACOC36_04305, partial [Fibrobacterota bacterium]